MFGSFNSWKIIHFSHKATSSEDIDNINQVVLNFISENMALLVQTGQYGSISRTYMTIMVYYVIQFFSEAYTLQ